MNKEINALNVKEIVSFNEGAAVSETDTPIKTSRMFIREKGIDREINAADICDKIITDDLPSERVMAKTSDTIKPLFRLYDASKLIIREIVEGFGRCVDRIADCFGSNVIAVAEVKEPAAEAPEKINGAENNQREQEDLMIKEAEKKNTNGSLLLLTAIGAAAAWSFPCIAYLCAGISLYADLKIAEGRSKVLLAVLNVIVLAGTIVCHAVQAIMINQ